MIGFRFVCAACALCSFDGAGTGRDAAFFVALRERVPTAMDGRGGLSGARGRTRTGMGLPPRDFRTRYSFHCCTPEGVHLGSGLYLHRTAGEAHLWACWRVRQGPSSLYTFPPASKIRALQRKGLGKPSGLARCCSHRDVLLVHRL